MATLTDVFARLTATTARAASTAGERPAIRLERHYATDADDLWSCWTEPERAARWLGELSGERREGGTVRLCMSPPDADVAMLDIVLCEQPRRLTVRWREEDRADSFVDLTLHDDARGGTLLVLEHVANGAPRDDGCGWEDFLVRLEQLVTTGDVESPGWDDVKALLGPSWDEAMTTAGGADRWPAVAGDAATLRHHVAAAPGAVWAALTEPAQLIRWFGEVSGDPAPGGDWAVRFAGGGASGTVRECAAGQRIVTTWRWDHDPPDSEPGVVTVTVTPAGGGTVVDVTHEHAGDSPIGFAAGWYAHARQLDRWLAGRDPSERAWQADWQLAVAMLRP